jgi:hypothetical protein
MEPNETQVIPAAVRLAVLNLVIGTTGPLHLPTLILYQNAVALGPLTALADLTVATFDGYAPVVGATWDTPYVDTDGSALVFGDSQTIVATGSMTPNTIYGYAAVNVGVTALEAAWAFSSPIGVSKAGDGVAFLPAFRYSGT